MDLLSRMDLKSLMKEHDHACVSLFMPAHRVGTDVQQDPIRYRNLLNEAEERLIKSGMRKSDAQNYLTSARNLLNDPLFWQHQSDGLAVFISQDELQTYRLPLDFDELVVVAKRFHVKPLFPLFSSDSRFYILALSQNEIRIMEGTRFNVDEIDVEDIPENLAKALQWDDPEAHLQFHTAEGPSTGGSAPETIYHGHGGSAEKEAKTNILRYFQKVDAGLKSVLAEETAPLILAGVDYLLPLYRDANSYRNLMETSIPGNPEELSANELHRRAWEILEPHYRQEQEAASERYAQLRETERASDELDEIVPAAYYGRVDQLFIPIGVEVWGNFDQQSGKLEVHVDSDTSKDLLNIAATYTFLNGGKVFALAPDELPDSSTAAAIFRY
jgi:hypothetical protein